MKRFIALSMACWGGLLMGWGSCIRGEWTWYFYVGFILLGIGAILQEEFFGPGL